MKKLTKTAALILSAVMFFGCTSNAAQSNVGDTTPPGESSVTDSENKNDSSATESSVTDSGSISDSSGEENNENLVKNIEGYQTFSYDENKYTIINYEKFFDSAYSSYDIPKLYEPTYDNLKIEGKANPIAIKCRVAGDSYFINNGKCGNVQLMELDTRALYTPVVIEEIVDDFGNDCVFKKGDIIYVAETFSPTEQYNEDSLDWLEKWFSSYQEMCEDESGNFIEDNGTFIDRDYYYNKVIKYYDTIKNGNGKYIPLDIIPVIMKKEQSYLIFVANENTPNKTDGNVYAYRMGLIYDLDNDNFTVYESEEADACRFMSGKNYQYHWKYLKEKYGEHFKS